jgi:cell division protein FtsZ
MSNDELKEKQDVPAYMRKGVKLVSKTPPVEPNVSRYNLSDDNELLGGNKFLHDNVD